jgi:membrane-associated phospholipid phosphatase
MLNPIVEGLLRAAIPHRGFFIPLTIILFSASPTSAREATPSHFDLTHTSWGFLALETTTAATTYAGMVLVTRSPTRECSWCESNAFDRSGRRLLLAADPKVFGYASHGIALGLVPLLSIGGTLFPALDDRRPDRGAQDAWIIFNGFVLTQGITVGVKRMVGRQRPAFHYGEEGKTESAPDSKQENLSFYSGDTAWAFSISATATTLAYLRNYETAPWILGGGALLATTTGIFRIAGDMHWTSDVLVGAAAGTTIGFGLPWLFHQRIDDSEIGLHVRPWLTPQSAGIAGIW